MIISAEDEEEEKKMLTVPFWMTREDHEHKKKVFSINWRLLHGLGLRNFSRWWCYIGLQWSHTILSFRVAKDGDFAWVQQYLAPCVSASAHYGLRYPKKSQSCGKLRSQQVLHQSHQAARDSFHRYFQCSCLPGGWSLEDSCKRATS